MQKSFVLPEKFDKLNFENANSAAYESESMSSTAASTPSTPGSPPPDMEIQVITENDRAEVLEFLQKFFIRDEPLNCYLKMTTKENPRCLQLEEYAMKDLTSGLNLKAVLNGRIVGVVLNTILHRGFIDEMGPVDCKHEKFAKILRMLTRVAKESNVFQYFPEADKALCINILSVNGEYRGKGIAKALMARSREIARENNCGFMTVDCSSHFTACAVKRLGFTLVHTLKYADYKEDGEVVFKPAPPHEACTVYVQKLE